MIPKRTIWGMFVAASLLASGCAAENSKMPPASSIATRPGVTVNLLVSEPEGPPKGIFLVYPGGLRVLGGQRRFDTGFFPRVPAIFTDRGYAFAMVDSPSDRPAGSDQSFRVSMEHAEDARLIVDALTRRWPSKPVYLIGHSAGAVSVLHIARTLKERKFGGIVLTSASTNGIARSNLPLEQFTEPVLWVHHRDDNCVSYQAASGQASRFNRSTRFHFMEVLGGDATKGFRCGPTNPELSHAHYFAGKEVEVVNALVYWAQSNAVSKRIGP